MCFTMVDSREPIEAIGRCALSEQEERVATFIDGVLRGAKPTVAAADHLRDAKSLTVYEKTTREPSLARRS